MSQNYNNEIKITTSASNVFQALTQQIDKWWGKIDKPVSKVGDIFTIYFGKAFWKFEVSEYNHNSKIAWKCIDGQPEFENEWVGTTVIWHIKSTNKETTINLIHDGLTPHFACYNICAPTWDMFVTKSLKNYLEEGKGMPHS